MAVRSGQWQWAVAVERDFNARARGCEVARLGLRVHVNREGVMPMTVGQKDVVGRMGVTRYAWKKALREGRLEALELRVRRRRCRYRAEDVEGCFCLEPGSVRRM